jgi:hypothetical protein
VEESESVEYPPGGGADVGQVLDHVNTGVAQGVDLGLSGARPARASYETR